MRGARLGIPMTKVARNDADRIWFGQVRRESCSETCFAGLFDRADEDGDDLDVESLGAPQV